MEVNRQFCLDWEMMDYFSKLRTWTGYLGKHLMTLIYVIKRNSVFSISVAGTLILHLVIAWQSLEYLEGFAFLWSKGPLIDDSYIIFKISRDLADWFSGVIPSPPLTSGVQPLIALLYSPFFLICWNTKELPIHLALSQVASCTLRSILVGDWRSHAIGWWLIGWIVDQDRQVIRGQQMAPQEGLHSVFGWYGVMDKLRAPNGRATL